jgi:AMMECR1 domain-containing protein
MNYGRWWAIILGLTLALAACGAQAQLVRRFNEDRSGAGMVAVKLARQALEASCLRRETIPVPAQLPALLRLRGGVFVSAMHNGAPRCCMGSLYPRGADLATDIVETAALAAAHDLRFKPLKPEELPGLRVIVSILDPPQPISDPYVLDPVTEGLAVRAVTRTGVVLPGETARLDNFVRWARIRAAATEGEQVQYLHLTAIRFVEPPAGGQGDRDD